MPDGTDTAETKQRSIVHRACSRVIDTLIPDDDTQRERGRWIERKLQSVMLTLLTVAIIWGVSQLTSIDTIAQDVANMRIQLDGTYRADVAQRDMQDLRRRIDAGDQRDQEYDQRLDTVERRIDRVEFVLDETPGTATRLRRARAAAADVEKDRP